MEVYKENFKKTFNVDLSDLEVKTINNFLKSFDKKSDFGNGIYRFSNQLGEIYEFVIAGYLYFHPIKTLAEEKALCINPGEFMLEISRNIAEMNVKTTNKYEEVEEKKYIITNTYQQHPLNPSFIDHVRLNDLEQYRFGDPEYITKKTESKPKHY